MDSQGLVEGVGTWGLKGTALSHSSYKWATEGGMGRIEAGYCIGHNFQKSRLVSHAALRGPECVYGLHCAS